MLGTYQEHKYCQVLGSGSHLVRMSFLAQVWEPVLVCMERMCFLQPVLGMLMVLGIHLEHTFFLGLELVQDMEGM